MNRFVSLATTLCGPLDRVRGRTLKALGPAAMPFIRGREWRVLASGLIVILTALLFTLGAPFWLLALGPIVWGIPHLVADLRYLVARPGLHRRKELWLCAGVPLLLAGLDFHSLTCGLIATLAVAMLSHGPVSRKAIAAAVVLVLFAGVVALGPSARIVFAHAHNFIAVMLWWCWRPRGGFWQSLIPGLFLAASLLILSGVLQPPAWALGWIPGQMNADYHLANLAPGVSEPWALRWVLLFAFAQAVHYGVWLRLMPEDDRPQSTPRTFAASARALHADLGAWFLGIALVLAVGLAVWAMLDLADARAGYLRMALFHGYLELAAAAYLFVEGRPRIQPTRHVSLAP